MLIIWKTTPGCMYIMKGPFQRILTYHFVFLSNQHLGAVTEFSQYVLDVADLGHVFVMSLVVVVVLVLLVVANRGGRGQVLPGQDNDKEGGEYGVVHRAF